MIEPTKKRLTITFTVVILVFNILLGTTSYLLVHKSLMDGLKKHIKDDIREEFLPYFQARDFNVINSLREDEVFQIISRKGEITATTYNTKKINPAMNKMLLKAAFSGTTDYDYINIEGNRYLIAYFPMDDEYSGRVIMPLNTIRYYEFNYIEMLLVIMPFMLLFSYIVSRYLVNIAMKPISEVFMFQETFSSNVLHELRSPLTSLKGNMEVSLRKERAPEEYREVLASNLKDIDRINNLLNNLYLLASSKFKSLDLFRNGADIKPITEDLVSQYMPVLKSKGINLDVSEISSGECLCDIGLIRRAIENLFDNAVKYTPPGGLIKLGVSKTEKAVLIDVSNTCKGLVREDVSHIFEPFYRGRNTAETGAEGMGLGLYIARYIVRSHGGELKVSSTDDTLSFTISLPLK